MPQINKYADLDLIGKYLCYQTDKQTKYYDKIRYSHIFYGSSSDPHDKIKLLLVNVYIDRCHPYCFTLKEIRQLLQEKKRGNWTIEENATTP